MHINLESREKNGADGTVNSTHVVVSSVIQKNEMAKVAVMCIVLLYYTAGRLITAS